MSRFVACNKKISVRGTILFYETVQSNLFVYKQVFLYTKCFLHLSDQIKIFTSVREQSPKPFRVHLARCRYVRNVLGGVMYS